MESDSILLFGSVLIVTVLALTGLLLWLVAGILYRASGLQSMVHRFRAETEPGGLRFGNQTVSVGPLPFRHCATAIVTPAGFYLRPWSVLPALLIPWPEIRARRDTTLQHRDAVELAVGSPVAARIGIFPDLFAALEPYLPAHPRP